MRKNQAVPHAEEPGSSVNNGRFVPQEKLCGTTRLFRILRNNLVFPPAGGGGVPQKPNDELRENCARKIYLKAQTNNGQNSEPRKLLGGGPKFVIKPIYYDLRNN